jgi:glutamate racemase
LVEEGYVEREASRLIARDYLADFASNGIDTLVLGCTHYPLLKAVIREVLGEGVVLVDSAVETAREVERYLRDRELLNPQPKRGTHKFYVSDIPDQFAHTARHFLGKRVENVVRIDVTKY